MLIKDPESARWLIFLLSGAAAFAALALIHKFWPGILRKSSFRTFDLLVAAVAALFVGVHATNLWHEREDVIVASFHRLYHDNWWAPAVRNTYWFGTPLLKCPLDLWIYQEILHETKPDVIVETGTWQGGSAGFFASLFDLMGHGRVITIDIKSFDPPQRERVAYLVGSSTSDEIIRQVKDSVQDGEKVMVVLDSDHSKEHVLNELRLYSELVTPGCYLVVEDTHLNGRPVQFGDGDPAAAVEEFLASNSDFEADRSREKFGVSWNRGGWLKRVR